MYSPAVVREMLASAPPVSLCNMASQTSVCCTQAEERAGILQRGEHGERVRGAANKDRIPAAGTFPTSDLWNEALLTGEPTFFFIMLQTDSCFARLIVGEWHGAGDCLQHEKTVLTCERSK